MTPEEITALFATAAATFQSVDGQPSDDDITNLRETLYPLLLDIPYDEGGTHNLIGILEPPTAYAARWGAVFPIPVRPPTYPAIPDDATPVVRARREAEHAVRVKDYAAYEAAERAVAKFIRDAVNEIWYRDLRHARSFYVNVTAIQLITHLADNCRGLHPAELVNLPTRMLSFYNDADGIPEYINMLEDAQRKLERARLPMSDEQLLAIATTSVLASGHFPRPTDDWEAKAPADKTWQNWKHHYRAAHTARRRQLLAAGTATMGAANAVTMVETDPITDTTIAKLDEYLDNLAAAATTEKSTLQQLTEANATLTTNVATLTANITALTSAYTLLAAHLGGAAPPTVPQQATGKKKKQRTPLDPNGYCWSHGYKVGVGHNSSTCTNKRNGHQDGATRANTMGGSTANKDK